MGARGRVHPSLFFRLVKIDVEQRLVYGEMTSETPDNSNEIMDYDTSKAYFEAWSDDTKQAAAAIGAESLGNVRAMHQPIAAGKLTQILYDDDAKKIDICSKIVDDNEWNKVLEGVYTGFSIGGRYMKKWADKVQKGMIRYTVKPVEVSLVDNPCNPTARFYDIVKADGIVEQGVFKNILAEATMDPTNEQVAARATELAKAAGDETKWPSFVDAARDALKAEMAAPLEPVVEAAKTETAETAVEEPVVEAEAEVETDTTKVTQGWAASDGSFHVKKADAIAHNAKIAAPPAPENPVAAALAAAKAAGVESPETAVKGELIDPVAFLADTHADVTKWHGILVEAQTAYSDHIVIKGLYTVSRLADLLESLGYVTSSSAYEAQAEGDGSKVPQMLCDGLKQLGGALVAMAQEEIAELLAELGTRGVTVDIVEYVALAAGVEVVKADEALVQKVGARNSASDAKKLQAIHDNATAMGASCDSEKADGGDLAKLAESNPAVKKLLDDLDASKAQITEAVAGIAEMGELLKAVRTEMTALKNTPAPMAPRTNVVEKGAGSETVVVSAGDAEKAIAELQKTAEGREMLVQAAIRASVQNGHKTS